ncbi:MAG: DNA-directed RNA polymerase subunit beta, partial [Oscillospiraceae bacterium]|nr:DNA-directed RNA polymerase subunit beta [Oscillospiraceae bacterium]
MHEVQQGKRTRHFFSKIHEALEVPDLIEVQKRSYQNFLDEGLREVLADASPITDYSESLMLEFVDYSLDEPKNSIERCRERDQTYAAPLKVMVRLTNRETHEIKESEVFMGDFPLMTEHGTFVINGAERVIVSQLVRSPGAYFARSIDKSGNFLYAAQMIPNRGAWIEFETDSNSVVYCRIDRARKLPVTVLLRALGIESDAQIIDMYGSDERVSATIARDGSAEEKNDQRNRTRREQALIEIYNKLRPGEPPSVESATQLINNLFFDPKRYDLAHVGRYKYNKKLAIALRIADHEAVENIVHPHTGELLVEAGNVISMEDAVRIQNAGINRVAVMAEGHEVTVIGNGFVDFTAYMTDCAPELLAQYDPSKVELRERVHRESLDELIAAVREDGVDFNQALKDKINLLIPKHILRDDILAAVSYQFGLFYGIGDVDDIDHLGNRRLRSVGELLQNQIR